MSGQPTDEQPADQDCDHASRLDSAGQPKCSGGGEPTLDIGPQSLRGFLAHSRRKSEGATPGSQHSRDGSESESAVQRLPEVPDLRRSASKALN